MNASMWRFSGVTGPTPYLNTLCWFLPKYLTCLYTPRLINMQSSNKFYLHSSGFNIITSQFFPGFWLVRLFQHLCWWCIFTLAGQHYLRIICLQSMHVHFLQLCCQYIRQGDENLSGEAAEWWCELSQYQYRKGWDLLVISHWIFLFLGGGK